LAIEIRIDKDKCKGCNICIEVCQAEVLDISGKTNPHGYLPPQIKNIDNCTGCGICEMLCPDFAIRVSIMKEENNP